MYLQVRPQWLVLLVQQQVEKEEPEEEEEKMVAEHDLPSGQA